MLKNIYLLLAALIFMSCAQKSEKITELSQLNDKRICILTGSASDIAARKAFPAARFFDLTAAADAAYSVKIGKTDAFIFNKGVLLNIIKQNSELILLDQPVSKVEVAAAFNKNSTTLIADINRALEKLEKDGTLKAMREKWIDTDYQTVPELPNINTNGNNGTIKMGTNAQQEPYVFFYNNSITGYDIELALRIGNFLDKKIEFVDMNFESLIPALQSGKIDFAMANFNITEERKQYISYSNPYLVNDISVLVRK